MPVPNRLLPRGVPRYLRDREVHFGKALALLWDHVLAPVPALNGFGSRNSLMKSGRSFSRVSTGSRHEDARPKTTACRSSNVERTPA